MPESTSESPLLRKARAHAGSSHAALGAAAVWRRVLPRVTEDRLGLELRVADFVDDITKLPSALEDASEHALLIGMNGGAGRVTGLCVVDPELLTGLIEIQTTGRLSASRSDPRTPTGTDYELAAHVIDAWLAGVRAAQANEAPVLVCARRLGDTRAAMLALDDGQFRRSRITLELGGGKRTGQLTLFQPEARSTSTTTATPENLRAAILPLPTEIEGVLHRLRLPLSRIGRLQVGEVLPLPGASVRRMTLEAPRGRTIALGHLGQSGGSRAVRVLKSEDAKSRIVPALSFGESVPELEKDRKFGAPRNPGGNKQIAGEAATGHAAPPHGAGSPKVRGELDPKHDGNVAERSDRDLAPPIPPLEESATPLTPNSTDG